MNSLLFEKTLKQYKFFMLRSMGLFKTHVWVYLKHMSWHDMTCYFLPTPILWGKIFTGLLFYVEFVIHKVWALDITFYRKCLMALSKKNYRVGIYLWPAQGYVGHLAGHPAKGYEKKWTEKTTNWTRNLTGKKSARQNRWWGDEQSTYRGITWQQTA